MNPSNEEEAWKIYEASFPSIERRRREDHNEAMKSETFYPMVILEQGTVIGILFYWKWEGCTYVEHLAFGEAFRGQGYGSQVLKDFCQREQPIVLEIEPPDEAIAIKRLHFYERLGFCLNPHFHLNLPYRQNLGTHVLRVMSYKEQLSEEEYHHFNKLLLQEVGAYCEK